jgi:hypothetical protein
MIEPNRAESTIGTGHDAGSDGRLAVSSRRRGTVRAWLAATFAGVTWPRFGVFCLLALAFGLSKPTAVITLSRGGDVATIANGIFVPFVYLAVKFAPVLLAIVAALNRGPRTGWARVAWLVSALIAGTIVGSVLMAIAVQVLTPEGYLVRWIGPNDSPVVRALRWISLGLGEFIISAAALVFWYLLKWNLDATATLQREEQDREEARREGAEARLQLLQAQIEPHFLFNSLASIRRLYETDPATGRQMLRHLSRYLAASLPILRSTRSTLGRELALAVAYLNVQKIRMGARLSVEVAVPQALHAIAVPPMMLATLVENAVIHGVSPLPGGGSVRIEARTGADRLTIQVVDTGRGLQDAWGAGVGLANIRARLHSEFGAAAELRLADNADRGVTAAIDLPFTPAAEALVA